MLFSTYGPVLDVVALKTMKMRGQAHIVYRDVQTATQAMRALHGFEFFGMEMVGLSWPYDSSGDAELTGATLRKSTTPSQSRMQSRSSMAPFACLQQALRPK
jgi:RNA recognition motif-containing protein